MKVFFGIAMLCLVLGALARFVTRWAARHSTSEKGSLFEADLDRITLKSADNVRLLSDDQIRQLQHEDE